MPARDNIRLWQAMSYKERDKKDMNKSTNSVIRLSQTIIVVCAIVFLWQMVSPNASSAYELTAYDITHGRWFVLLTSMFMHNGIMHIIMNMVSLWYIGKALSNVMDTKEYSLTYSLSGVAGGLAWVAMALSRGELYTSCVGASGAIFGLLGAYGAILLKIKDQNGMAQGAFTQWLSILGINLVYGILNPGIALEAHIGGLVCGLICGFIFTRRKSMIMA